MQTQVTNMAKCEEMGALTQWKWHRMRRACLRIESDLLACDSDNITVAGEKIRTRLSKKSPLGATRQNQQILASSFNNKRVRASETFALLAVYVDSIDCKYLRRNGVNACTQCREQQIRQGISHRLNHRGSSWRRRHMNKPPSGRLIVWYSLFRQGKVRMSSTQGIHLLSA